MNGAAKRTLVNVSLLAVCQALFLTTTSTVVTIGALVGHVLAPDKSLATLPFAVTFLASAATAFPASLYMRRVGRRAGFAAGGLIGAAGSSLAALAVAAGDFASLCLAMVLVGTFNGFAFFYRFAAAEAADEAFRAKAISLVLAGGVVAAFTGPNLANLTTGLLAPYTYAGSFAVIAVVHLLTALVVQFVDIPRPSAAERSRRARPLSQIARRPEFLTAVLGATAAHAVMMLVMTVTPLAMKGVGCTLGQTAFVIQGHILGMYVPAFFTGHLIQRHGVLNVMLWGAALLAVCAAINLSGVSMAHFSLALIALGVGWNFLFIGATTLLVQSQAPADKAKAQGLNDLCVYSTVTVAVLASGVLQVRIGWEAVNLGVVPFAAAAAAAALALLIARRSAAAR